MPFQIFFVIQKQIDKLSDLEIVNHDLGLVFRLMIKLCSSMLRGVALPRGPQNGLPQTQPTTPPTNAPFLQRSIYWDVAGLPQSTEVRHQLSYFPAQK